METNRDKRAGRLPRRTLLKIAFGAAAVAAAKPYFASTNVMAAALAPGSVAARILPPILPPIAEVTGIADQVLALRTKASQALQASMHGFPPGLKPRVGDLVAVAQRDATGRPVPPMPSSQLTSAPLCRPAFSLADIAADETLSAVPLATWRRGIPAINRDGRLSIDGVALVESAAVREAAVTGQVISISTLDSTLDSLQVLGTRA